MDFPAHTYVSIKIIFCLKNDEKKRKLRNVLVENCSDPNLKWAETEYPNSPMFCYKIMQNTHAKYLCMYICKCELFLFIWCAIVLYKKYSLINAKLHGIYVYISI